MLTDVIFKSYASKIDEGLGECVFSVARKFDDNRIDLLEGNRLEVFVCDVETITSTADNNTGTIRVYSGRIESVRTSVSGSGEEVEVRCMGYWVSLGLDVLKSSAQTTLYTRTTGGVGTTSTPQSVDIGTVVTGIMARFKAENPSSPIGYSSISIPAVGSSMSYVFQQRTYREAIQRCLNAAPYGYFSFLDKDNIFHFKGISTTPDHKFYFGKHFSEIEIERSITRPRNVLLLWASVSADPYKSYSDAISIAKYGRQVERVTEDSIQDEATMDLVGSRFIAQNKDVEVRIRASIIDSNGVPGIGYDIESIQPGDTCAFYNFDSTFQSLFRYNMIITEIYYTPDYAQITVEPVRMTTVSDITARLKEQISEEKSSGIPASYTT